MVCAVLLARPIDHKTRAFAQLVPRRGSSSKIAARYSTAATARIEAPVIPQMDVLPSPNYAPAPSPSFSDRITTCLEEGAAGGLGPSEREEYSRSCANR